MSDAHRLALKERNRRKIQVGMIINRLHKCIEGTVEMSTQQVNAARILLAKAVPDKRSVEIEDITNYNNDPDSISNRQLTLIARSGSDNVTQAQRGKAKPH